MISIRLDSEHLVALVNFKLQYISNSHFGQLISNILTLWSLWSNSAVHVWIRKSSHEWIRANHFLHPHSNGKLSIAISKLVHVDCNDIGVVVKLYEALEPLSLEPFLNLGECFFVHLVDGILDCRLFSDGASENSERVVPNVFRKI